MSPHHRDRRPLQTGANLLETRLAFRKVGLTEASGEQLAHQPGVLDAVSRHTRTYPMLHGAAVRLPELERDALETESQLTLELYGEAATELEE